MRKLKTINLQKTETTGAGALVSTLIQNGIDTVFGYPGATVLSVYNELSKTDKIKHILARHEQGAVHSAEGWARASGKCGVVLVTSGPGFTNTVTGLANANIDNTPLIVITGMRKNLGKNEFQEFDVQTLSKTCSKKFYEVTSCDKISEIISNAIEEASSFPCGSVVVGVTQEALESSFLPVEHRKKQTIKVEAPHSCVLKTIELLKNSQRPLMIVGGGCSGCEDEIYQLSTLTHIPIVNTLMAKGTADNLSFGLIGVNGIENLNRTIENSDVVLALGTRFSDRTTNYKSRFLSKSKIININISPNTSENVVADYEIIGELKIILQQMIGVIKAKKELFDLKYSWIDKFCQNSISTKNNEEYNVKNVIKKINEYTLKYHPIVTTDVGNHQIDAIYHFKVNTSSNFMVSGGFGVMGYGLPAAIGAQIACPKSLVLNITGDGSFQMNIQELGTCAEYNLPLKIFIINNSSLKMVEDRQIQNKMNVYQSKLLNPDFVKLAQAYGITGYSVYSMEELKKVLKEIFILKKTVVIDIKI